MNKPLAYIIDLDGTLYDNSHRQHLIPADRSNTAGWVEFNCACTDDVLREDMSDLVRSVLLSGREVIFLTGRGEAAGEQTMQRLLKDFNFIEQPTLIMRPMDCHTSAAEFKRDAVKRIRDSERWAGYDLIALEDDPSIVEVMRGMGVTVLHIDSKCCTVEKPHHNGMMQLSNELADLKRRYAELQEVVGQRNGECDRLINEQQNLVMLVKVLSRSLKKYNHTSDLVKRAIGYLTSNGMMNATDCLRGGLLSAHDQTDTAPAQFESLAGEPVNEPYKLPANTVCKDAPEHIWLQTAGVWPESGEFSELTWCSSNQHQDDTLYVRADVAPGNYPVIQDAYDIEAFGIFSATEGESGLLLQIEQFCFGAKNCPQIGRENMVPKFALQAIINRLQAHCNSMGEDALIDIFASSAAPQQEVKQ